MSNLLSYRKLLRNFSSIYELQAIPGWNLDLIRLQPYITIAEKPAVFKSVNARLKSGQQSFLLRVSRVLE